MQNLFVYLAKITLIKKSHLKGIGNNENATHYEIYIEERERQNMKATKCRSTLKKIK